MKKDQKMPKMPNNAKEMLCFGWEGWGMEEWGLFWWIPMNYR